MRRADTSIAAAFPLRPLLSLAHAHARVRRPQGTVASFVQPKLLARILDATGATAQTTANGSWALVLLMVALVNVLAAVNYALHATVSPVERTVKKE